MSLSSLSSWSVSLCILLGSFDTTLIIRPGLPTFRLLQCRKFRASSPLPVLQCFFSIVYRKVFRSTQNLVLKFVRTNLMPCSGVRNAVLVQISNWSAKQKKKEKCLLPESVFSHFTSASRSSPRATLRFRSVSWISASES